MPQAETCVAALEKLIEGRLPRRDRLSLCRPPLIPVYDYVSQTRKARRCWPRQSYLESAGGRRCMRPTVQKTRPSLG